MDREIKLAYSSPATSLRNDEMPEPKPYWTELLEPIDPSLKTPVKLLASIAISLKRIADQGEPQVSTALDLSMEPPRNPAERLS